MLWRAKGSCSRCLTGESNVQLVIMQLAQVTLDVGLSRPGVLARCTGRAKLKRSAASLHRLSALDQPQTPASTEASLPGHLVSRVTVCRRAGLQTEHVEDTGATDGSDRRNDAEAELLAQISLSQA